MNNHVRKKFKINLYGKQNLFSFSRFDRKSICAFFEIVEGLQQDIIDFKEIRTNVASNLEVT